MHVDPVAFELFGRPVYWYGILIAVSVLVGIYLAMRYAKRLNYDPEMIVDFCLLAIPLGIIGARLYYVIFEWDVYKDNPLDIVKIWEGGLAIYGTVIGGLVAAFIFSHWRKMNFWDLVDIVSPSLILGQAIGRWGNFFNQEAYGRIVTDKAWQWFPYAVYIEARQEWHMATFFYESMWNLLVFLFLLNFRKRRKISGEVFLVYLFLYSCGRVVIEGLRTDSLYLGPVRISQLLSAVLIVLSAVLFVIRRKKHTAVSQDEACENNLVLQAEGINDVSLPSDELEIPSEPNTEDLSSEDEQQHVAVDDGEGSAPENNDDKIQDEARDV